MTTFDFYLLKRYWHVFAITFLALLGLYVVIDVFTNVDDFLNRPGGTGAIASWMAVYYGCRTSLFFEMIGGTAGVIAAFVVFSLMQRNGELNPILAAGICSYRLLIPVLWGTTAVNLLLIVNQELIIPRIASLLEISPANNGHIREEVESAYDPITEILINAKKLNLLDQKIEHAEFTLPAPKIVESLITLKAAEAIYQPARGRRPNGWLLKGAKSTLESLKLTAEGRKTLIRGAKEGEIFVITDVSFDMLFKRDRNYEYLSTQELMRRIKNPSFGINSTRGQSLYLNGRITRPLINWIVVILGFPLVLRRESRGLVVNLALASGAMGFVFAVTQVFLYLGKANVVPCDLAAWGPVIICGTLSAWVSGWVRT